MATGAALFRKIGVPLLCFAIGGALAFSIRAGRVDADRNRIFFEAREGGYRFINPLLECDSEQDVIRNRELHPFKEKVEQYLSKQRATKGAEVVSLYFRELNDGLWFVIGDRERFTPASMRKVPMLIAILKQSERTPGLLTRRIAARLKRDYNASQNIKPSQTLEPGREYTIADLLLRMVAYSDNNAFMLLSGIVDQRELDRVYDLLAVPNPSLSNENRFFDVQTYASFLRILYNSTYLTRELSDLALEILSRSEFKSGIVSGVPSAIAVAHKFGEHTEVASDEKQLHDCGIVFYPRHPYLLCIMSKGMDFAYLDNTISSISRLIYEEVDTQHRHEH